MSIHAEIKNVRTQIILGVNFKRVKIKLTLIFCFCLNEQMDTKDFTKCSSGEKDEQ